MKNYLLLIFSLCVLTLQSTFAQNPPHIVTSIHPLKLIAESVAEGTNIQVKLLLPANQSPHHYALKPSDMAKLESARRVFWIGPTLESFLPRILSRLDTHHIALAKSEGLIKLEPGHVHTHDHDNEPMQQGFVDPHFWLSPDNVKIFAAQMGKELSLLSPDQASRIQQNVEAFNLAMDASDDHLKAIFKAAKRKKFIGFHDAYVYLTEQYGLDFEGAYLQSGEHAPSVRHLTELTNKISKNDIHCIVTEPQFDSSKLEKILGNQTLSTVELDILAGSEAYQGMRFPEFYRTLGVQLARCLNP